MLYADMKLNKWNKSTCTVQVLGKKNLYRLRIRRPPWARCDLDAHVCKQQSATYKHHEHHLSVVKNLSIWTMHTALAKSYTSLLPHHRAGNVYVDLGHGCSGTVCMYIVHHFRFMAELINLLYYIWLKFACGLLFISQNVDKIDAKSVIFGLAL